MNGPEMPLVAIIVVTWNQCAMTCDCLESLALLDYPPDKLRLIVVDNASQDSTADTIEVAFPNVVVLRNMENLGFVGGNNVGINHVLEQEVDYVMLLNNDTIVATDMLRTLTAVAESDSAIGIVGPKIFYYDQPDLIWAAGASIDWNTGKVSRLEDRRLSSVGDEYPETVDYVHGCAICVKRSVIDQIGLLDDRLFIYYEETDWCVRASRREWRIVYVPQSRIWHRVSATMGTASPATEYYMSRNALLFLAKHLHGWSRVRAVARNAGRSALTIAAYTVKSRTKDRLRRRDARLFALRDAVIGRWGKMGPDVERVCYPRR